MTLAEARNVMNEYNSDLVNWIDFAIYCFIGYAGINLFFVVIISAVSDVGFGVKFYQGVSQLVLILRLYVAIKGVTVHWTDEQRAMRLPENLDTRQRDAAIKIQSGCDAMIWLGGFIDLICIPCICGAAFMMIKNMSAGAEKMEGGEKEA